MVDPNPKMHIIFLNPLGWCVQFEGLQPLMQLDPCAHCGLCAGMVVMDGNEDAHSGLKLTVVKFTVSMCTINPIGCRVSHTHTCTTAHAHKPLHTPTAHAQSDQGWCTRDRGCWWWARTWPCTAMEIVWHVRCASWCWCLCHCCHCPPQITSTDGLTLSCVVWLVSEGDGHPEHKAGPNRDQGIPEWGLCWWR
jgi:hypothetical protein